MKGAEVTGRLYLRFVWCHVILWQSHDISEQAVRESRWTAILWLSATTQCLCHKRSQIQEGVRCRWEIFTTGFLFLRISRAREMRKRPVDSIIQYYDRGFIYHDVKRSDVTGKPFKWLLGENNVIYDPPAPCFIVLVSLVKTFEVKAIEFHRIV